MDNTCLTKSISVVGMGAVSAVGDGVASLLRAVRTHVSGLAECERFTAGAYMTNRVGSVPEAVWKSISPSASPAYALAHRALEEARQQAAPDLAGIDPARCGLVLSTTKAEVGALGTLVAGRECDARARRHILPRELAADLAGALGIGGPVQCVSVACISGLLAIQQGARLILSGAADAVLVAGVDILSHFVLAGFSSLKSLDPQGCRPFDKTRQGLSLGEAAGALVLVKSGAASATLARITGWGASNDANHLTGPSRDGSGLALAVFRALKLAGCAPDSIEYVNAHGTGTVYNDRMEALAFKTVFGNSSPWVGASKGMLGHTLGAAGVIESVVCIASARERLLPGTPGFGQPDDEAPARIAATPREAVSYSRILKTNSGFGGTNGALVLEVTPS
jgi:3-oxoacyl-(acyl-carrier-protein) synthase